MGFIKNLLNKPAKKDLEKYYNYIQLLSNMELGIILASVTLVREDLLHDSNFPKGLIGDNDSLNNREYDGELALTVVKLLNAKAKFESAGKLFYAKGFTLLAMTLRSKIDTESRIMVDQIWKKLKIGESYVNKVFDDLVEDGIPVSDWARENYKYNPNLGNY